MASRRSTSTPGSSTTGRRFAARLGSVVGISVCALAVLVSTAAASAPDHGREAHHLVFVQTDNTAGNTVVAYDRADDGTLTQAGVYQTGGLGGVLTGSVVDHLASQGSLAYEASRQLLFAVNAGSNTVSVFAVHGERLDLVQVVGSGGAFPVSISERGGLVYVANALDGGSIQGFLLAGDRLVSVPGWNRPLGLDPTATPQFVNTPGQIVFTPDGSSLIVTTKANGSNIDVFPLGPFGRPATSPVVNSEPGTVPFGATFDRSGHLVIAEAGTNAVTTYSVGHHGALTRIDSVAVGQQATCWVTRIGNTLYASNAGSGNLSELAVDSHASLTHLGETATDAGTVDAAATANGRYLYVQAGAAGQVDEFSVAHDGALTPVGSIIVPGAVGGEGIVAL